MQARISSAVCQVKNVTAFCALEKNDSVPVKLEIGQTQHQVIKFNTCGKRHLLNLASVIPGTYFKINVKTVFNFGNVEPNTCKTLHRH